MCPAFSLLAISEAVSQADISTEVGITGWNSVSWERPLPPPPWALGSSGAPALPSPSPGDRGFHGSLSLHSSTVTELKAGTGALLVPRWGSTEHRTSHQRGLGATWGNAVGQLCRGWGSAVTTKLCVLSPHTHTEIVHSNQCGRKCLQDLSWEWLIINNSWIARRASAVTLWVGKPLGCSQQQHSLG